jgi:hypothetical protein
VLCSKGATEKGRRVSLSKEVLQVDVLVLKAIAAEEVLTILELWFSDG